jgi:hypothetical protein
MSKAPIKNGVNVYLTEYGSYMRSDLYKIGNCLCVIGTEFHGPVPRGDIDIHLTLGHDNISRISQGYRMIIVPCTDKHVQCLNEILQQEFLKAK